MKDKIILGVLVTALLGATAFWFFLSHEKVEVEERSTPAPEVRANRHYGFFKYLEARNISGENIYNLNTQTQLPTSLDTLIFNAATSGMTTQERLDVLDWVAEGGQLFLRRSFFRRNFLLTDLGIDDGADMFNLPPRQTGDDGEVDQHSDADIASAEQESSDLHQSGSHSHVDDTVDGEADSAAAEPLPSDSSAPNVEHKDSSDKQERSIYRIHLGEALLGELEYEPLHLLPVEINRPVIWSMSIAPKTLKPGTVEPETIEPADHSNFAFGFRYGLGFVSVLTEHEQMANDYFYLRDNSFIMHKALTLSRAPGKVWIVSSVTRPDLWSLIWWRSAHLVLWGALGVVFFFWWASQRFGRQIPDPPAARREFHEHIAAGGRFLWRAQQHDALICKTRDSVLHKVYTRYPHFHESSAAGQRKQLEKALGNNIKLWDTAMKNQANISKHQFTDQIRALQKLWELI